MSGNFAIKGGGGGGGVGRLMANAILNFHFDFLHPSLNVNRSNTVAKPLKPRLLYLLDYIQLETALYSFWYSQQKK